MCYNSPTFYWEAVGLKYLKQIVIILGFCLLGEILAALIPLPIPASIYGLIALFVALMTGILKETAIAETANFLISGMSVLFVAPAVNILAYYGVIAPALVPICLIVIVSTFLTFFVSGIVTQLLQKKEDKKNG